MNTDRLLPDHIKAVLLEADATAMRLAGESHHLLYQLLRVAASRIANLDAFYVGFYCENSMMVFPYSFDGHTYYDPNKFACRPGGLSEWILKNKKPYRFSQDDGALLFKGKQFGQREKASQDAVVVPVLEPHGLRGSKESEVIGVMSMQSYQPGSYDEVTVHAVECLACSLALVQQRERDDAARRQALATRNPVAPEPMLRPSNVVNQMLDKMQSIRHRGEAIRNSLRDPDPQTARAVEELIEECHRRQTETIEIFLQSVFMRDTPLSKLSDQERRILFLLVEGMSKSKEGYTNGQLADIMGTAENTIRTQLRSVYKKMGVSGRAGVVEVAKNYIPNLPTR